MRIIPSILTLFNLFLGCVITLLLIEGNLPIEGISFLILITLFFDFSDGLIARKFNLESKLGAQLDSLADLISFGLVPGIIMYKLFMLVQVQNTREYLKVHMLGLNSVVKNYVDCIVIYMI